MGVSETVRSPESVHDHSIFVCNAPFLCEEGMLGAARVFRRSFLKKRGTMRPLFHVPRYFMTNRETNVSVSVLPLEISNKLRDIEIGYNSFIRRNLM